ncbi:YisB protein [Nemania sp. NC0429]|nr:YisB protein [Nemania sp. NC0429]
MSSLIPDDQRRNYELFRDCLATALLEKIAEPQTKPRRRTKAKSKRKGAATALSRNDSVLHQQNREESTRSPDVVDQSAELRPEQLSGDVDERTIRDDGDDLAEFTEYIATLTFAHLPTELKTVDYHDYVASPSLQNHFTLPLTGADIPTHLPALDPSIADSLTAYGITDEARQGVHEFLAPVLTAFLRALSTPPPPPSATRADATACELCGRDWINLSYHHLIPRFVHAKAVKRGWHRECDLQSVAWLCGACHGFVHRFAGHEELARRFYSVERLLAEDEVRRWVAWVGRLRWKGK